MSRAEPSWNSFLFTVITVATGIVTFLLAALWIVDPHGHLLLSPPLARAPINTNQRYSYPAIARSQRFDSAVFGTSTVRLLQPDTLDKELGGRFANLAMNSATGYEQSRILELFARTHASIGTVLIGMDVVWCQVGEVYEKYTFREFPEWLYDENPWNDFLHLLNGNTLEQAGRQIEYFMGKRKPRYGFDGFENFLEARNTYDYQRALGHLYGEKGLRPKPVGPKEPAVSADVIRTWRYPTHGMLDAMLARLPADTRKILLFVPYHYFHQPTPMTKQALRWQECKRRVTGIASRHPNTFVLDFMIDSAITRDDAGYWDPLHFSLPVGERIVALIAEGVRERRGKADLFDFLGPGAVHFRPGS